MADLEEKKEAVAGILVTIDRDDPRVLKARERHKIKSLAEDESKSFAHPQSFKGPSDTKDPQADFPTESYHDKKKTEENLERIIEMVGCHPETRINLEVVKGQLADKSSHVIVFNDDSQDPSLKEANNYGFAILKIHKDEAEKTLAATILALALLDKKGVLRNLLLTQNDDDLDREIVSKQLQTIEDFLFELAKLTSSEKYTIRYYFYYSTSL